MLRVLGARKILGPRLRHNASADASLTRPTGLELLVEGWFHAEWMDFQIVGQIRDVETIALARSIRVLRYLRRAYGRGRWRKMKGVATVLLLNGSLRRAELHWYEAHGIGKKDVKIKRYLDES